jgi:hypothetical protein
MSLRVLRRDGPKTLLSPLLSTTGFADSVHSVAGISCNVATMNELTQGPKDTNQSCVFDFPDRPVRPVPPIDPNNPPNPPIEYPYEPYLDWPPHPPVNPIPGRDPIPGSNLHPHTPTSQVFATFQKYTSREGGLERRDLLISIAPNPFPARFLLSWSSLTEIGLVQAANEYTPRDTLDGLLQAENGHSTLDDNTACGIMIHTTLFPNNSVVTYLAYFAMWWDLIAGHQLYSFAPVSVVGGIDNSPHLTFDNAAAFDVSPANFAFWAAHSNLGLPAGTSPVTKTINTAKIFTDNQLAPYSVNIV